MPYSPRPIVYLNPLPLNMKYFSLTSMCVFPALWTMSSPQIYFWSTLTCLKIHCGSTNKSNGFKTTLRPQLVLLHYLAFSTHCSIIWKYGHMRASLRRSVVKNPPTKAGDQGLISELGRSHGEGNGNIFQHSCLRNPVDRGVWWLIQFMGSQRVRHDLLTE